MPDMTLDQALATIPKDQKLFYKDIAKITKKNLIKFERTISHITGYLQYRQIYVLGRYNSINDYLIDPIKVSEQFELFNLASQSNFNKSKDLDDMTALMYRIVDKQLDLAKIYKRESIEVIKNSNAMSAVLIQLDTLKTKIDNLITKLG